MNSTVCSRKLKVIFDYLEFCIFQDWKKANETERIKIVKKLGEFEGKLMIEEINKECKRMNQLSFKNNL